MTAEPVPEGQLTEWLLRAMALIAYGFAVFNLAQSWWIDPKRLTVLLLLLTEGYTLLMVLLARRASVRDLTPLSVIATMYAAFFFVLLNAEGTQRFVHEGVGLSLQMLGLACQFASKYTLGRSFGLLPAQRRIVVAGPYRWVRHPIYLGYLISHIGFLLVNFSWRNLGVFVLLYAAQLYRIRREEAVLCSDDNYRAYTTRVRWRLVPGLF